MTILNLGGGGQNVHTCHKHYIISKYVLWKLCYCCVTRVVQIRSINRHTFNHEEFELIYLAITTFFKPYIFQARPACSGGFHRLVVLMLICTPAFLSPTFFLGGGGGGGYCHPLPPTTPLLPPPPPPPTPPSTLRPFYPFRLLQNHMK